MSNLQTTQYAKDTVTGKTGRRAGKKVLQSCQRHLDDLKRQDTANFPYIFDEERGYWPVEFIETFCKPSKGNFTQLVLQPWQQFVVGSLYGWVHRETKLRRFREGLIFVSRKNGKALDIETPIPTVDGWKTIGQIKVGDYVYSADGKPTKVTFVSETFKGHECYEVAFEDGETITADAEHLWTVTAKDSRHKGYFNITTAEMAPNYFRKRADKKGTEYKYRVPLNSAIEHSEKKLLIDPYVLGVWLGDGSQTAEFPAEQLRTLGVLNNKHIPEDYLRASIEQRTQLLKGLMDTDGYVEKRGQCEFVQKSRVLIDNFSELLSSLGIKHTIREKQTKCNGKDAGTVYSVLFYVDKSKSCFNLSRKHGRLKDKLSSRMENKSIVGITKTNSVPTKCIAVDSPDHLYLAGRRMTPTHNTTLVSGLSLYAVGFDNEQGAQIYQLANSMKQARLTYDECRAMVSASTGLKKHYRAMRDAIHCDIYGGKIEPQASDSDKLDGLNCHLGIFDEIHEYKNYKLINVIKNSRGAREQPLLLYITTAGYVLDGPLVDYYERGADVLDGVITDERKFYYMAEIDTDDDVEDTENWYKANPSMGVTIKHEDMVEEWNSCKDIPAERNDFITKRLNAFVQADEQSFLPLEVIKRNNDHIDIETLKGQLCIASYDLSTSEDFTAAGLEFPLPDGRIFFLTHSWIPQAKVDADKENRADDFREWAKQGWLTIVPGEFVQKEDIYAWIIEQSKIYAIAKIAYDPANSYRLNQDLATYGGADWTQPVRQGALTLSPALKDLKELFLDGKVVTNENKLFRWYLNNVRLVVADRNGNWLPTKQHKYRKIDGFAALYTAHTEVMKLMAKPQENIGEISFVSAKELKGE